MYTLIQLSQFTKTELQSICIDYGIKSSGNLSALIPRIRFHQEKIQKEKEAKDEAKKQLLENGAKPRCEEFEKIIRAFEMWTSKEGFAPFKGYMTKEKVHINEVRAAFADYNCEGRDGEIAPNLSEFFFCLFNWDADNKGSWDIYDTTEQDREFDCDSEYNSNWLVAGMTEIYNTL